MLRKACFLYYIRAALKRLAFKRNDVLRNEDEDY